MKIAVLGNQSPIKATATAGTEIFTYTLVDQLVRRGHDVTLFGMAGSKTPAKFVSIGKKEDLNGVSLGIPLAYSYSVDSVRTIADRVGHFDVIHNNGIALSLLLPALRCLPIPTVTTVHLVGNAIFNSSPEVRTFFKKYASEGLVFPSKHAATTSGSFLRGRIIYHGIDTKRFAFNATPKDYLLFIGRITHEKGTIEAITAAKKAGVKIIVAGLPALHNPRGVAYFKRMKKLLGKNVVYKGALTPEEKVTLYQNARAVMFPIQWDEPFGLVMTEAMSCGTPVIGFGRGAVPEVVKNGVSGFVVPPFVSGKTNMAGLVNAIKKLDKIDRAECRAYTEKHFSLERMIGEYEVLYNHLIESGKKGAR